MAKLWSQLMTYSDGQFLQKGIQELDDLPRDEWCASWFRRLPRFSFQSLVAGMLEIALLKAYAGREQPSSSSLSGGGGKGGSGKGSSGKGSSGGGSKGNEKRGSSSKGSTATAKDSTNHQPPSKRLAPGSSTRLLQVERLSDYWKTLTLKERHGQFQLAYKNIHDLVTIHGKEVKRTKMTDTMKEEKANIHQWFTLMFRSIDQSEEWDRLEYV